MATSPSMTSAGSSTLNPDLGYSRGVDLVEMGWNVTDRSNPAFPSPQSLPPNTVVTATPGSLFSINPSCPGPSSRNNGDDFSTGDARWTRSWLRSKNPWFRIPTVMFLLLTTGTSSVKVLKDITGLNNEPKWIEFRDILINRINHQNILATLALTAAATFLTTEPPRADLANWTHRIPYILVGTVFCLSLLAVVCGGNLLYVISDIQAQQLQMEQDTPLVSHMLKFAIPGLMLAFQVFLLMACGILASVAIVVSVWAGTNVILKGTVPLVIITIALLFCVILTFNWHLHRDYDPEPDRSHLPPIADARLPWFHWRLWGEGSSR